MTRLAIMQPYLFPYLGYFQLLRAVDVVLWLDDAQMVPRSWVTRNRILVNGTARWFSVPATRASRGTTIAKSHYALDHPSAGAAVKTLQRAYAKRPGTRIVHELGLSVLASTDDSIAVVNEDALRQCVGLLEIPVATQRTSETGTSQLRGVDRILELCGMVGCSTYVNLPGGRHLYHGEDFAKRNIALKFLKPAFREYPQPAPNFVPGLSILDAIACLGHDVGTLTAPGTFDLED